MVKNDVTLNAVARCGACSPAVIAGGRLSDNPPGSKRTRSILRWQDITSMRHNGFQWSASQKERDVRHTMGARANPALGDEDKIASLQAHDTHH
jgi:hypothetical protein